MEADHLDPEQVEALVERIDADHGRLDVLVNDIWGGELLFEWNAPLWEHDLDAGLRLLRLAIDTHLITSHFALPLLIREPGGLVVEMTDGTREYNDEQLPHIGLLRPGEDLGAAAGVRARPRSWRRTARTAVALTPGWLRSEMMLDNYGVTEDNWREAAATRTSWPSPRARASSAGPWPRWPPTPTVRAATAAPSPPASWRASTASPTSTAPSPTAGATWSRSRTPASRPIRRAIAEDYLRLRDLSELDHGVTFVHLYMEEDGTELPLGELAAFKRFRRSRTSASAATTRRRRPRSTRLESFRLPLDM